MLDPKQQISDRTIASKKRQSDIDFLENAVKRKTEGDAKVTETQTSGYFEVEFSLELMPGTGVDEKAVSGVINDAINYRGFVVEGIKSWKENAFEWGVVCWIRKDMSADSNTQKQQLLDRISKEHDRLSERDRSPWAFMDAVGEMAHMKIVFDDKSTTEDWTKELQECAIAVAAMALDIALEAGIGGDRDGKQG